MSIVEIIHEKFSIAAWSEYNQKRYGMNTCKKVKDAMFLMDLRDIYKFQLEQEACSEIVSCRCSIVKIEEAIKTA